MEHTWFGWRFFVVLIKREADTALQYVGFLQMTTAGDCSNVVLQLDHIYAAILLARAVFTLTLIRRSRRYVNAIVSTTTQSKQLHSG